MATPCPHRDDYLHVETSCAVLDILDGAGNPVPAGNQGRIFVTSLYSYATPFIRYEIGDLGALVRPYVAMSTRGIVLGRNFSSLGRSGILGDFFCPTRARRGMSRP